jgi:hypothetical protein
MLADVLRGSVHVLLFEVRTLIRSSSRLSAVAAEGGADLEWHPQLKCYATRIDNCDGAQKRVMQLKASN